MTAFQTEIVIEYDHYILKLLAIRKVSNLIILKKFNDFWKNNLTLSRVKYIVRIENRKVG